MTTSSSGIDTVRARANPRYVYQFKRHEGLADTVVVGGEKDALTVDEVVAGLPSFPAQSGSRGAASAARRILQWLHTYPGAGWQERWLASGADDSTDWIETMFEPDDRRQRVGKRNDVMRGLIALMVGRIVFPGYGFMAALGSNGSYAKVRALHRPDLFVAFEARVTELAANSLQCRNAVKVASKIVLHTGRDLNQLTADDLLGYRAWNIVNGRPTSSSAQLAWAALVDIADFGGVATFTEAIRRGQRPTVDLVDGYRLQSAAVRGVFVRYLDERRPAMDYNSFASLAGVLVGNFWADIELHHPGIDSLDLPADVADAWKQRLRVVVTSDGDTRLRLTNLSIMATVRAFYRDIQEWATEDPSWVEWSVPNPIRKKDIQGFAKARARSVAVIHQRIRERLPHLPTLVEVAENRRARSAALLAATTAVPVGAQFDHEGTTYRRVIAKSFAKTSHRHESPPVQVERLDTGGIVYIEKDEHDAFWSWAVIETLRHTGVRIEELLEITHLGVVSYKLPSTGEVVPMLQIVPSKSNEERLLLVSPELAHVLATIIARLRSNSGGAVPITSRYDRYERVMSPPLPHLFQHRQGWKWAVPGHSVIQKWLTQALTATGIVDAAGKPLHYTPHDFRRMFATESVGSGLPVHIVSKLLGHKHISTTQVYTAVFDEQLVRAYRTFLDARRAQRPDDEYREPTDDEWNDFQQHFEKRKLELGTCGRPYGTPCKHEHACIRCPSLHIDPRSRDRLAEIAANLRDRIDEARGNGWTGEVEGLTVSLNAAAVKIASLDRLRNRANAGSRSITDLGIPVVEEPRQ